MNKLDLIVIILTYNEEIHIGRALDNVCPIAKKVYVVDSPSTDRTVEICGRYENVEVVVHKYPGNQAEQFNWALDNLHIDTEWVLRLDADEYLTSELIEEMQSKLPELDSSITAVVLPLGRAFMGKVLKHEPICKMIRLFRIGKARYGTSLMDEHLQILSGTTVDFHNKFIDDNRNTLTFFLTKHIKYADREAIQMLKAEFINNDDVIGEYCDSVKSKKAQKDKYAKMPPFWRAIAYFLYRYFVKRTFMDGKEGFLWCFFQAWWYRTVVDAKIVEIKKSCENNPDKIKTYLANK